MSLLLEDPFEASFVERVELAVEHLASLGGGDPGVADEVHRVLQTPDPPRPSALHSIDNSRFFAGNIGRNR